MTDSPVLLGDLPSRAARLWPESVALVYHGMTTTFRQLDEQVDRAARNLIDERR